MTEPRSPQRPTTPLLARIRPRQSGLDSPPLARNTPTEDPLVGALAQLVRDRWAAEGRELRARRLRLRVVEDEDEAATRDH